MGIADEDISEPTADEGPLLRRYLGVWDRWNREERSGGGAVEWMKCSLDL